LTFYPLNAAFSKVALEKNYLPISAMGNFIYSWNKHNIFE